MAREFGPSRFESLSQGSAARAAMVEAGRISLAGDIATIAEIPYSRKRSHRTPLVLSAFGAIGITAALACGGAKGTNQESTPTSNNPLSTTTRIEPTPTATQEAVPTSDSITSLISQGFRGISVSPDQIPSDFYRDPDKVSKMVSNCYEVQPVTQIQFQHNVPVEVIIAKDNPNYATVVLGQCGSAADATKQLYEATQKQEFLQANRLIKLVHRAKFMEFSQQDPRIDESYWNDVESRYYIK